MNTNWGNQMPIKYPQEHSNPTFVKRRHAIPLKTLEEPTIPLYHPQEESLSPKKDNSPKMTYMNIRLGKLNPQNKTRSTEEDPGAGIKEWKTNVKRSNSAKVPLLQMKPPEFVQSPNQEEERAPQFIEYVNQSRDLVPALSTRGVPNIPMGNYGYDGPVRDPRYHRISEESNESGIYTNSEKSSGPNAENAVNESDSETIVDPNSLTEVPNVATGWEPRYVPDYPLDETLREKFVRSKEPIYENYPISPRVASSQSDSFLSDQILKLRIVLEKVGDVDDLERLCDQLKEKDNTIYQLQKMVEKLNRDNGILHNGLAVERQNTNALTNSIRDLNDRNNKLLSERFPRANYNPLPLNSQSNRYLPSHQPQVYPPMQGPRYRYGPDTTIQGRGISRPESAPDYPENPAYFQGFGDTQFYPPQPDPILNFTPCYTSQSDSRALPRSTPSVGSVANVPLNPHFPYQATHNSDTIRNL